MRSLILPLCVGLSAAWAGEGTWQPAVAMAFSRPVWVGAVPGAPGHLVVVEQAGRVWCVADDPRAATGSVMLDVRDRTRSGPRASSEEGLLTLAFHPRFPAVAQVFLWWMPADGVRRTELVRHRMAIAAPFAIDPAGARVIAIDQPYPNHNGAGLAFAADGTLFIGVGDGGSGGDPQNRAQDPQSLLGKILRIDPGDGGAAPYTVPADNPFSASRSHRPEIWAIGVRNPWRIHVASDGRLWAGDVGQNAAEEVSVIPRGGNMGWRAREGFREFKAGESAPGMVDPVVEYPRTQGRSITGGLIYTGTRLPGLRGRYVFGDYASGSIWSIPGDALPGSKPPLRAEASWNGRVSSFGTDGRQELLAVDHVSGRILRLVP